MRKIYLPTLIVVLIISGIFYIPEVLIKNKKLSNDSPDTLTHSINDSSGTNQYPEFRFYYTKLRDFYPAIPNNNDQIISYSGFDLSYNEVHEQANWVIYLLTKEKTLGLAERSNNFREDKNVKTGSAIPDDYKYSGYDKGHLAPAADMKWSEKAMDESFLMSNISPQKPGFNRGIWKKLEDKVRDWAIENDSIIVVTGPIFKDIKGKIGENQVTVPGYFFKVVMDVSCPDFKAIAFIIPNESSKANLNVYAVSVDNLELFTSYDFFARINSTFMNTIENQLNINSWSW